MTVPPRLVRPSRESVDASILDVTAGLIARRGMKDTAVQAVADETGYSKAGILNRFESKSLLIEAALEQCIRQTAAVLAKVEEAPAGVERDAAAVAGVTDLALARPGWVELVLASLSEGRADDVRARLTPVSDALMRMFGVDEQSSTPLERRARVVAAIGAIGVLALMSEGEAEATAAQAVALIRTIGWNALRSEAVFPAV
jgi:AcrR family transcriptional regulator